MAKFCELGIESDVVIGKGIEIEDLFGRRILIEKTIIQPTKYPGKNASGLRMQMQVVLATFNESSDKDGDCYTKNPDGTPVGERRSCFTGSDILISAIQKAESNLPVVNKACHRCNCTQWTQRLSRSGNVFNSLDYGTVGQRDWVASKVAQFAKEIRILFHPERLVYLAYGWLCRFLRIESQVLD